MILPLLTAARRRVACLVGRHDWARGQLREATHYTRQGDVWVNSRLRAFGYLGSRTCRVAACQRSELEIRPGVWREASRVRGTA